MQFNTTCKDYDSINRHSHQSTPTTGPQGWRGPTMTMPGGEREQRCWSIYCTCAYVLLCMCFKDGFDAYLAHSQSVTGSSLLCSQARSQHLSCSPQTFPEIKRNSLPWRQWLTTWIKIDTKLVTASLDRTPKKRRRKQKEESMETLSGSPEPNIHSGEQHCTAGPLQGRKRVHQTCTQLITQQPPGPAFCINQRLRSASSALQRRASSAIIS